jgi:tetratricopeptide (TPR) repeat protein
VIIESGYAPEGYDWIGHYRTVVGYDDNLQVFYIYDSYLGSGENGAGMAVPYTEFDRDWQNFNRVFITLYDPAREGDLVSILGERADVIRAAEMALEVAQQEARENPQNVYAWFNMGTALTRLERYPEAAAAYDRATQIGLHYRMTWYQFGIFEAYFNTQRYDDVLSYVEVNLGSGGEYVEETHYWQGRVYAAQGRTQEARAAFNRALQHNPRFQEASNALAQLGA